MVELEISLILIAIVIVLFITFVLYNILTKEYRDKVHELESKLEDVKMRYKAMKKCTLSTDRYGDLLRRSLEVSPSGRADENFRRKRAELLKKIQKDCEKAKYHTNPSGTYGQASRLPKKRYLSSYNDEAINEKHGGRKEEGSQSGVKSGKLKSNGVGLKTLKED